MKLTHRKILLMAAIAVSAALPLYFVDFAEPNRARVVTKFLAKTGSMAGTILLMWQFILGSRSTATKLCPDLLWTYHLHRIIGTGGVCLIALHPAFITVYYAQAGEGNPWRLDLSGMFSWMVLLGIIAFSIMAVIVVSSTLLRKRMSKRRWYEIHLGAYLVPPLVFAHSLPIGMTLRKSAAGHIWLALIAVFALFVAHRAARALGWGKAVYRVVSRRELAPDITEIGLEPESGPPIEPATGQFVYINRHGLFGGARPYTAARFDPQTRRIAAAVKAQGSGSRFIRDAAPGDRVDVDGPYGVFFDEVLRSDRPLVMAAGGIGITPFLRLCEYLERNAERQGWLFYGNKTSEELPYQERLVSLENVKMVPVVSDDPGYEGEKGNISLELMMRYLPQPPDACEYLLCGPPAMIKTLRNALQKEAGVPRSRIHYELFSL